MFGWRTNLSRFRVKLRICRRKRGRSTRNFSISLSFAEAYRRSWIQVQKRNSHTQSNQTAWRESNSRLSSMTAMRIQITATIQNLSSEVPSSDWIPRLVCTRRWSRTRSPNPKTSIFISKVPGRAIRRGRNFTWRSRYNAMSFLRSPRRHWSRRRRASGVVCWWSLNSRWITATQWSITRSCSTSKRVTKTWTTTRSRSVPTKWVEIISCVKKAASRRAKTRSWPIRYRCRKVARTISIWIKINSQTNFEVSARNLIEIENGKI